MATKKRASKTPLAIQSLRSHFAKMPLSSLVAASRTFPTTARADLQLAIDELFSKGYSANLLGIHPQYSHEALSTAHLATEGHYPVYIGPLQHEEVDVGNEEPRRCLRHGLWLGRENGTRYVVLMTPAHKFGQELGVRVEVAVAPGDDGLRFSREFFDELNSLVNSAGTYKGKVISLEQMENFSGDAGSVKVHKLRPVKRDEVILPEKTIALLERNITDFIAKREDFRRFGLPVKKGLLFYGPPGTGKTHTIHYLATQLKDHTTLLITADQVGLLGNYIQLARFLQPAMVIIEDVDLIARAREQMHGPCEESLLNKLLNEMDGLREDACILFVLTTNRPEHLEAALTSRPGRIDQAIEFPLPDDTGRRKLIRLYSRSLPLKDAVVEITAAKTKNVSAAFIKELMRRAAQYYLEGGSRGSLQETHIEKALEEMIFSGGSLNLKLLGAGPATGFLSEQSEGQFRK